jgi:hypothetical protein
MSRFVTFVGNESKNYHGRTEPVGYRIDAGIKRQFEEYVEEQYGSTQHYVRQAIEQALMEYMQASEQTKMRRMLEEALGKEVRETVADGGAVEKEQKMFSSLLDYNPSAPAESRVTKDLLFDVCEAELNGYPRPEINPQHVDRNDIPQASHHKQSIVAAIVRYECNRIRRQDVVSVVAKFVGDTRHLISRHVPAVWDSNFRHKNEREKFTNKDGGRHEFFISTPGPEIKLADHNAVNGYIESLDNKAEIRAQIQRAVSRYGLHPDFLDHPLADEMYEIEE